MAVDLEQFLAPRDPIPAGPLVPERRLAPPMHPVPAEAPPPACRLVPALQPVPALPLPQPTGSDDRSTPASGPDPGQPAGLRHGPGPDLRPKMTTAPAFWLSVGAKKSQKVSRAPAVSAMLSAVTQPRLGDACPWLFPFLVRPHLFDCAARNAPGRHDSAGAMPLKRCSREPRRGDQTCRVRR
jgi:hypothetical protein